MRERTFHIRVSEEEWAKIVRLADHYALTVAALIRMLIKRELDRVFPDKPRAKK